MEFNLPILNSPTEQFSKRLHIEVLEPYTAHKTPEDSRMPGVYAKKKCCKKYKKSGKKKCKGCPKRNR